MEKIRKLLRSYYNYSPQFDHQDVIKLTYSCEFEPHGRASEAWEGIWKLVLPTVPYYWQRITREWTQGATDSPMMFRGRTYEEVVNKARSFLIELEKQNDKDKHIDSQ